jgi:hypothetical protein
MSVTSKDVPLQASAVETAYNIMSEHLNTGHQHNNKSSNKSLETVTNFKYKETRVTKQYCVHESINSE